MIWTESSNASKEQVWAEYIANRIASYAPLNENLLLCGEVAEAIGAFLAAQPDAMPVRSEDVDFMVARAIWLFGRPELAREWVRNKFNEYGPTPLAEVAMTDQAGLALWRIVFNGGLLRPVKSLLADDGIWVLDIAAIRSSVDDLLELGVFVMIDALLELIAFVWDRTGGCGLLCLWHTFCMQPARLDRRSDKAKWARELSGHCTDRLNMIKIARQWSEAPHVLLLDLS